MSLFTNEKTSIMNKKEIQSRREFFKSAAKKALPVVGAIAVTQLPFLSEAHESHYTMGCSDSCYGNCYGDCSGTCYTGCTGSCNGSCRGGCQNSCDGGCMGDCYGSCRSYSSR